MNRQERDILHCLMTKSFENQRMLAEATGYSLGSVNRYLKELLRNDYINENMQPTKKTIDEFHKNSPQRAIILAAGIGMRMVPINTEISKGLIEVNGEPLIERIIKQLKEVGIREIYIVVGFMKEKYEYLMDKYDVDLIVNAEYMTKNNIYSLKLVDKYIENSYIIPCDIWCTHNPFDRYELYSWYMVSDLVENHSSIRVNRKKEIVNINKDAAGNAMIGIAYITKEDAQILRKNIEKMCCDFKYDDSFWEEALFNNNKMIVEAKIVLSSEVIEINTYEQLRELDCKSNQLKTEAIKVICKALNAKENDIVDINILKKGMTNRSFYFNCKGKKYIMRIPGEGTDRLIDRVKEAEVYNAIKEKGICDDIIYINPQNGYKITEFLENARVCNPKSYEDIKKCMCKLKEFHKLKLKVKHEFNIFEQIEFYESLWGDVQSIYNDYKKTKKNIFSLKEYIDKNSNEKVLTHIDAVPDNFLFIEREGKQEVRLIDWEYAGMQDPHVDLAMFCIYSLYDKIQIDELIKIYFEGHCDNRVKIKIYCYIAVCGLLWSNWCEYKRNLGIEFGEYSLRQYHYAKEYYKIVQEELKKEVEGK